MNDHPSHPPIDVKAAVAQAHIARRRHLAGLARRAWHAMRRLLPPHPAMRRA